MAMTKPDYNKPINIFAIGMAAFTVGVMVALVSNLIDAKVANAELRKDNEFLANKLEIADRVCRARFSHPVEPKPVKRKRRK